MDPAPKKEINLVWVLIGCLAVVACIFLGSIAVGVVAVQQERERQAEGGGPATDQP